MTRPSYKLKDHLEGKVVLIDWCTFKLSKLLQVKTNFADDVLPPIWKSFREQEHVYFESVFPELSIFRVNGMSEKNLITTLRDAGRQENVNS